MSRGRLRVYHYNPSPREVVIYPYYVGDRADNSKKEDKRKIITTVDRFLERVEKDAV